MKLPSKLAISLLLLVLSAPAVADPFVNLDFEQATVPPGAGEFISAADAFPGWTARIGSFTQTDVSYDNVDTLGAPVVALYDVAIPEQGIPLLQGQYEAFLIGDSIDFTRASLGQVGDIPIGTNSIRLVAERFRGPPRVTVDGIEIPMVRLSGISFDADLFAGDIAAFAGMTAEIRFSSRIPPAGFLSTIFDSVSLSPDVVPEPSALSTLGLGVAIASFRRRRQHVKKLK